MKIPVYLFVFLALCSRSVSAADLPQTYLPPSEKGAVIYLDKKTLEKRADLEFSLNQISDDKHPHYELIRNGFGDCDKHEEITWMNKAEMKEEDGFLYTLHSTCSAKDKNGVTIVTYNKVFDYDNNEIVWSANDKDGKTLKTATFPIKGKTADDVTLIYFLKAYVANRDDPDYGSYYLLTNEPRLYKCNIRIMGYETCKLPIGEKNAVKLKLTGDMGIVDDILDRFVPHTYVWYEPDPPYTWLQYQGLETSVSSANVIISLSEYSSGN